MNQSTMYWLRHTPAGRRMMRRMDHGVTDRALGFPDCDPRKRIDKIVHCPHGCTDKCKRGR